MLLLLLSLVLVVWISILKDPELVATFEAALFLVRIFGESDSDVVRLRLWRGALPLLLSMVLWMSIIGELELVVAVPETASHGYLPSAVIG